MSYAVLRVLFNLWAFGALVLLVHAVSLALFGKGKGKLRQVIAAVAVSAVWPISLFSPAGRKVLFNRITKL